MIAKKLEAGGDLFVSHRRRLEPQAQSGSGAGRVFARLVRANCVRQPRNISKGRMVGGSECISGRVLLLMCMAVLIVGTVGGTGSGIGVSRTMIPASVRTGPMRLRGGQEEEGEEVVEMVEETVQVAEVQMTKREIDAKVAELMAMPMPDFVKVCTCCMQCRLFFTKKVMILATILSAATRTAASLPGLCQALSFSDFEWP